MAKEYIEREALLKTSPFTKHGGDTSQYTEGYLDCAGEAREAVRNAPTADVVEVVRCKDCGYFHQGKDFSVCDRPCEDMVDRLPTDFCSRGRRKDGT